MNYTMCMTLLDAGKKWKETLTRCLSQGLYIRKVEMEKQTSIKRMSNKINYEIDYLDI